MAGKMDMSINGEMVEEVGFFKYRGSRVMVDECRLAEEVRYRVREGSRERYTER